MNFNHVLIDGDIWIYRVGFTTQDVPINIAKARISDSLEKIQHDLNCEKASIYLSETERSNFRYNLYAEYKANRKTALPRHYFDLREYLIKKKGAIVHPGQEADDSLGISLSTLGDNAVLASIDKDLDQIPGWHYHFVKDKVYKIEPLEGLRWFYSQCLIGDKGTDNIEGVRGIGVAKATRILEGCQNEREMYDQVKAQYERVYGNEWQKRFLLAGRLLKIRQKENEPLWDLPLKGGPS